VVDTAWALTQVDVLDIATTAGASGIWSGNNPGTDTGTSLPSQVATNVEFKISRRYRGGKPRMFLPSATLGNEVDAGHWSTSYVTQVNTQCTAFFAAIAALSVGAVGSLTHINLSYYSGFTNITNSSGRERAVPKYRATALVDHVTGYNTKLLMSSQKRRRNATTA
jgi:hypothetical protein